MVFSIIARGARGGKGADGMGISKGATAIAIVELSKNQQLYILVGQEGGDACRKVRIVKMSSVYIEILKFLVLTNFKYFKSTVFFFFL